MSILDPLDNPEFVEKRNKFDEGLLLIEEKYKYWFEQRKSPFEKDEHDRLHNHYQYYRKGYGITFWFNEDSEVPVVIRQECTDLFNQCFNS
ncbi:hypothetical protein AB6735_24470 [Mucilaginibacter sp. RCC_168]|uniref:hypothetical protein n=1 Tax=Mucilaginibacter sp. RCC_168 TaxID=3239221 RepID=UPI003524D281